MGLHITTISTIYIERMEIHLVVGPTKMVQSELLKHRRNPLKGHSLEIAFIERQ